MRIAFFSDTGYVGAREWIAYLSGQSGIEVHAIVFPGDLQGIPRVAFHALSGPIPKGKARFLACVPALRRTLQRIAPDLLIAYRIVSYGFSASLTGFHPLVLAAQGQFIVSPETPRFFRHFARRAVRRADLIHSWAPPMTASLVSLGAPPDRILTLPRGVDETLLVPREEPPPPLTLITTRQLEPYYNFPTLLRAVRQVEEEVGEVRYLIAGEGSARAELQNLAESLGLGRSVRFLGKMDRERLPGLMGSAHLYISAVPSDGTSASLLEAMAGGVVPIVADNESNRCWIVDGEGGRLIDPFDAGAYASSIVEAWKAVEWRRRVRETNRRTVESRASWKKNMARFVAAYRELLAARQPGGAASLSKDSA